MTDARTTMLGHSALFLLVRLKMKALVRQQVRRLKRVSGWIFAALGGASLLIWMAVFFVRADRSEPIPHDLLLLGAQFSVAVLFVLTIIGAFSHRGLYLPKAEIELAFSAPVSRSDLVRYRMLVNVLRSCFAGVLFGVGAARRMPVGFYGFVGVFMVMITLPILGQAASLLLGDAENRLGKLASRLPLKYFSALLGAVVGLGIAWLFFDGGGWSSALRSNTAIEAWMEDLVHSRVAQLVLLPFKPWALLITTMDARQFLAWFAFCGALWWLAFDLTARVRVDFRELSLETSADVAKRLNRMRTGGVGASGGSISKRALGWRAPWIFGHSAFGAIAWLKLTSMMRKARGTLIVSIVVLSFVTLLFIVTLGGHDDTAVIAGAFLIAVLGTLYLCAGLRFDFRSDLEHMESIKSWPVGPTAAFLATILPEIVLVSVLLALSILARALVTMQFRAVLIGIIAFQPLVTTAWIALDNAVFLYSPVRYAPGQEGALQHMGRSIVLMLLRLGLFGAVLLCAGMPAVATYYVATEYLHVRETPAIWAAGAVAWVGLALVDAGVLIGGGKMLRRFDVSRDRA